MSKRTEKRIGEVSVNESVKHPMPTKTKNLFIDLFDAYKEAKKLTDEELKYDRMKWLKDDFNKFPYEYTDYNIHRWTIGGLLFFWSRVFEMVRIFFGFREDWINIHFSIFHVKTGEEIFHGLTFRLFENLFDSCKDKEIMDARNYWWRKHVSEKMVREFKE